MKKSYLQAQKRGESGIRYKHDLGQHFLYDDELLQHLVQACQLSPTDSVLEIGPGSGALTRFLCRNVNKVIAVEADEDIIPYLKAATLNDHNLTIVQGDIRKVNLAEICKPLDVPFSVVANIPYNITTPIFDLLMGNQLPLQKIAVMIQKEVAQKLLAMPSTEQYGPLSIRCQLYWEALFTEEVPAERFTPPPKVDSTFIILKKRSTPLIEIIDEARLWRMVKAAFCLRRKTLTNALKSTPEAPTVRNALTTLGLSENVRAEELSVTEWVQLSNLCS